MKVLFVANEFFSWGVYGGFGAFTRKLAGELVKRNVDVEVFVHQISNLQRPVGETEVIDGVPVKTLPRKKLAKIRHKKLYRTDADLIHSQCGMYDTYLTFRRNPNKKKIVTIQDLRTKTETELLAQFEKTSGYPWYKKWWAWYVYHCFSGAVEMADKIACQANLLFPKVKERYHVQPDLLLPNFIDIPSGNFKKTSKPVVLWLGRLDPVKHPELCFELARKVPDVDFYVLGKSHEVYGGERRDLHFRNKYRKCENLHFMGFQSGEAKEKLLSKAWILINTSYYECLPVSFLEALAHKCALLSTQNPDHYSALFGSWAYPTVDSLKYGLLRLLQNDSWKRLGKKGFDHVKKVHSTERGVQNHIKLYEELTT